MSVFPPLCNNTYNVCAIFVQYGTAVPYSKRVFSDTMSVSGSLRVLEGPRVFLSVLYVFIDVLGRMVDYFELCDSRCTERHALLQDVDQIRSVSCTL